MQWPALQTQPPPFPISSLSSATPGSCHPLGNLPPICPSPSLWAVAAWNACSTLPIYIWEGLFLTSLSLRGLCGGKEESRERVIISAFTQLVVIRRQGLMLSWRTGLAREKL